MKFPCLIALFFALLTVPGRAAAQDRQENRLWVFQDIIPGSHRGHVTCIQYDGERILSAGEDGFLEIWDQRQAVLRFQISRLPISAMAVRPGKTQIACIETDDLGQYRISAWDYGTLANLFTLRFRDPVQSIGYSAGGTYLIISRSGSTGIVLADSETGELLLDPRNIPGEFPLSTGFAAVGRTEQVMLTYSPAGLLSYWELQTGGGLHLVPSLGGSSAPLNFSVPPNINSPVLFGNNRFFAGFDREGLVILRADTGAELARDSSITRGKLAALGGELYCLPDTSADTAGGITRIRMNNTDRIERREYFPIPAAMTVSAMLPFSGGTGTGSRLILGTAEGELLVADLRFSLSAARKLTTKAQTEIPEIAVGNKTIAFLAGGLGYIPLDFLELKNGDTLNMENPGAYTRIGAAGNVRLPDPAGAGEPADRFLLWQDESPLPFPAIRSPSGEDQVLSIPANANQGNRPSGPQGSSRFPLSSVSVLEDQGLFLDTGGNITVLSLTDGRGLYAESFTGAMDAAFIDRDNIVLGRNAPFSLGAAAPFLKIDIKTGETVPIPYPAAVGVQVYRGAAGRIYGVTVENTQDSLQTAIISLDTREGIYSPVLVEYNGEDTRLSIAEADGFLASNMGGDQAGIYAPWGTVNMERGPGLPL
ncbi:MAG: WD40 repeat domain-containing protein, partial [Treponema sp.]|nr:WD40 repeat domain-containing protein [Treponema sp.]